MGYHVHGIPLSDEFRTGVQAVVGNNLHVYPTPAELKAAQVVPRVQSLYPLHVLVLTTTIRGTFNLRTVLVNFTSKHTHLPYLCTRIDKPYLRAPYIQRNYVLILSYEALANNTRVRTKIILCTSVQRN